MILRLSQAANALNLSPTTLRRMVDRGQIGAIRMSNGERRVTLEAVQAFARTVQHLGPQEAQPSPMTAGAGIR